MVEIKHEQIDNAQAGPSNPSTWPTAPIYYFKFDRPELVGQVDVAHLQSEVRNNFFRSAKWSPDGSAILTVSEDRIIRIYRTPEEGHTDRRTLDDPVTCTQPDAIHSATWFPSASTSVPGSFCFVASVRDTPVRLIDASDGRLRATYPIVDHRERFISPHCLAFNPTASKLYAGFENAIEVLEISEPGHGNSERLKTSQTRKGKGGQKGIVSALAFSSDYSGRFAAGTFSGSVAIYDEDSGSTPVLHLEGIEGGGVTQIAFHPLNPNRLFIASRRSDVIQVYDLSTPMGPIAELSRDGNTNQRIWFDVDPWGRYLSSGDRVGIIRVWDITQPIGDEDIDQAPKLIYERKIYNDTIGSVGLHPYRPLVLTVCGSRDHAPNDDSCESEDEDSEEGSENEDGNDEVAKGRLSPDEGDGWPSGNLTRNTALSHPTQVAIGDVSELNHSATEIRNKSPAHCMKIWSFAPL